MRKQQKNMALRFKNQAELREKYDIDVELPNTVNTQKNRGICVADVEVDVEGVKKPVFGEKGSAIKCGDGYTFIPYSRAKFKKASVTLCEEQIFFY